MTRSRARSSPPASAGAGTGPGPADGPAGARAEAGEVPGEAPETGLARRARAGDRGAFSDLYRRFSSTVHGVLIALVPAQEARDLVQEVFLSALRSIDGLDRPERVGPWLCTIARNRARDLLRRRTSTVSLEPLEPMEDAALQHDGRDADAGAAEEGEAALVLEAIRALPQSYAETLTLRLVEGLGGPEIAERTGLTHGSVRVNLHRGMKLLRERLERSGLGDRQP